ncbi:MAG: 2-hydroxyacyl-CoA dehydratase, partial [Dehalococcoidia bacterium]
MESTQKTTAVKATESARKVRGIVKALSNRAREAKESGMPVAYCMVASFYDDILRAMDVTPVWTENYAGLCAAKRDAERFLVKAESDGYANVLCGYARLGIGFDALRRELGEIPPDAPDGGMVEPDMLLGSSGTCDPRFKWYQSLGHYMDTPVHSIDIVCPSPDADLAQVADYYVRYQAEQFRGLIAFLEKHTGRKFDPDRLWEVLKISDETVRVYWEAYQLRKDSPCPM